MHLLPYLDSQLLFNDGYYVQALNFCLKKFDSEKCSSYYKFLKANNKKGFFTCPYGMSTYIDDDGNIFSGFRERTTYDKIKSKNLCSDKERKYNPILDSDEILRLAHASLVIEGASNSLLEKKMEVESLSHEVKSLNSRIKEHCELILQTYHLDDDVTEISGSDLIGLSEEIQTIFLSSSMISSRYLLMDYEKNPEAIVQGSDFDCNVYKKFDKIRRIYRNYLKKNVPIVIDGKTYKHIKAYPSFEMIPLLLIDNAVKYTYSKNNVNINFIVKDYMVIEICSYSPYCSKEECEHIFEKGFRGKNAIRVSKGSGIGLYFVKLLCDLHNIKIAVFSDSSKVVNINGVAYAPFKITLKFSDIYDV